MSTDVETIVVGAGVVGLAIARSLAAAGQEVMILEQHGIIGSETSSRNSEVIHAGSITHRAVSGAALCRRQSTHLSLLRENGVPTAGAGSFLSRLRRTSCRS